MIDILFLTVPNCVQYAKAKHVIEQVKADFPEYPGGLDETFFRGSASAIPSEDIRRVIV